MINAVEGSPRKKGDCKHLLRCIQFCSDQKFDLDEDGKNRSASGVWTETDSICSLIAKPNKQFEETQGFNFCSVKKQKSCCYYECEKEVKE